uniref:Autophagy-related protein 16 domain-containing protein n=1 Tax=Lotharella oceanica TaxID=641309 RepID=A0A7S2XFZ4_9EUKA
MSAAHIQSLEHQVKQKDEELAGLYKLQATNTQKMLSLSEKAQADAKLLEKKDMEIKALQEASETGDERVEHAMRIKRALEGENAVLKQEIESLRKNIEEAHKKIQALAKENQVLVERILKMKNQQADQMNQMNEMYEKALKLAQENAAEAMNNEKYGGLPDKTGIIDKIAWQRNFDVQMPTRNSKAFIGHKGQASALAFDRRGRTLASCGTDSVVRVYDVKTQTLSDTLSGHTAAVLDIEFSEDDKMIMAAGNDARAIIWSNDTKRQLVTFTGHASKICACAFSLDSTKAFTGSHDRTLRIWDVTTGGCRKKVQCGSAVNYLSVCAGGNIVGTAHLDASVRLWSARDGQQVASWTDIHTRQATSVEFSNDGIYAVTNSRDNTLRLIDIRTYNSIKVFKDPSGKYRNSHNWNNACFSPDGKYVVAGSSNSELFIWDVKTGKLAKRVKSEDERVTGLTGNTTCVRWSPNGQNVVSCDNLGFVMFWTP